MAAVPNIIEIIAPSVVDQVESFPSSSDFIEVLEVDPDTLLVIEDSVLAIVGVQSPGELEVFGADAPDIISSVDEVVQIISEISPVIIGGGGGGGDGSFLVSAETDVLTDVGMPVYVKANTHVDAAKADSILTRRVVGLATEVKAPGFAVEFMTQGVLTLDDWSAITGAVSLTPGMPYFLSFSSSGKLALTFPSVAGSSIVKVGTAISTVALDVNIGSPLLRG